MANSSNILKIINIFLNKKINKSFFECCICNKEVKIFYLICKPGCIDNSYCEYCINRILEERNNCPFTNISFTYDDICLDYRKNKEIYEQIYLYNNMEKYLINCKISINIEIDNSFDNISSSKTGLQ